MARAKGPVESDVFILTNDAGEYIVRPSTAVVHLDKKAGVTFRNLTDQEAVIELPGPFRRKTRKGRRIGVRFGLKPGNRNTVSVPDIPEVPYRMFYRVTVAGVPARGDSAPIIIIERP